MIRCIIQYLTDQQTNTHKWKNTETHTWRAERKAQALEEGSLKNI